ncbi:hypothetical protein EK21DRAFT_119154 [Setomelanomma holmii]|uniref:Uncharacterized protein n=1 Tax=Setomelanomma holmii TaxID=210430 RepID=A0A9P4LGB1_9PLEO|nr:hypothetical protein EK21DRAFT_119154 [Setomelanomma holmii]
MPTNPDNHYLLGFPGLDAEDPKWYIRRLWLVADNDRIPRPKFLDKEVQKLAEHVNKVVNTFVKDEDKRQEELRGGAFLENDALRILNNGGFGRSIWGSEAMAGLNSGYYIGHPPRWGVDTKSGYENNDEDSIRLNLRFWMAARIQAQINCPLKERKRKRSTSEDGDASHSSGVALDDRAATPPTSSGNQAPSALSPLCADVEETVQASVAVSAPPPTEAVQTPTATPTRSSDTDIGRSTRSDGEETGQWIRLRREGGLATTHPPVQITSPGPENHTAQKPPPPARLHIPGLPNPVRLGQMTLVLTRDAEWNGQGLPTAHLTKRKVIATLENWTPGNESRAIREWAEDGSICLKDDEVLVLMCPGPSAFWYFPTRDFEVVHAALIQEHQFNATQMCMKIMNDWRPKTRPCEDMDASETVEDMDVIGTIESPLIDMGSNGYRLRLARSFFRNPVDSYALPASAGRLELARSTFLVPPYAPGEEDGPLYTPWLPDVQISEATILVKATQTLNDCLVAILTLDNQERRLQVTWKTILLVQQLDHMIATYNQARHEHDTAISKSARPCKMYESVALRCPSELPPGQYLTRKSTGVVLILCSDKKAVGRHVMETGCILPGDVTHKPIIVVVDDLGPAHPIELNTIEEVDSKLFFHRSNSDTSAECPVNNHPAIIISTMTALTSWRWFDRLVNDAYDATSILVSLLVLDGEDHQTSDLASFDRMVDRVSTPERVYEDHQNIDGSPVPTRFLFTFPGPTDEHPFSDRLARLIETQNRGSWKRQSIRDHGGPATPLSSTVARICHQASAAPVRILGDKSSKLIKLLDTARIRVPTGLLRVQDDMWKEWMSLASSASLTEVDIAHSAEQLEVSNDLFQLCERKKAELHSKGLPIDPTLRKLVATILAEQYAKCAMFGTFPSIARTISDPSLAKWRFRGKYNAVKTLLSLGQDPNMWSWFPRILEGQAFRQSNLCGQMVHNVKGDPKAIWLKGLFLGSESHHNTFPVTLVFVRHILTRELTARMLMDMLPDVSVFVARIRNSWKTCTPETRNTDANKVIDLDTMVDSARILITTADTIPGDLSLDNIDRCVFLEQAAIPEVELKIVHDILKNRATSNIAVLRPFTKIAKAELAACSRDWRIEHSRFFDNLG